MVQAIPQKVSFDEFMQWYPEHSEHRYELYEGLIIEMPKPKGKHSEVAGLLSGSLFVEISRLQLPYLALLILAMKLGGGGALSAPPPPNFIAGLSNAPYFIPRECIVRVQDGESGYEPDVIVLDRQSVSQESRWEKESVITLGMSVRLVIEVVSTNWQDDYLTKLRDYEASGIREYWVADYLGLGGRLHIGFPKQPTFSVYQLVEGEYEVERFRLADRIVSPTFPDLDWLVDDVFKVA